MANTPQARKRARQAEGHRRHNASQRSALRTAIKKVVAAIATGEQETANAAYKSAVTIIDRSVTHGVIHKNKAARHKSRLNSQIKALGA